MGIFDWLHRQRQKTAGRKYWFNPQSNRMERLTASQAKEVMITFTPSDEEVREAIRSVPAHFAVGPTPGGTGTNAVQGNRIDKTGAQVVGQGHGKYYQANECRQLFGACYSAGAAPGATISTTAHLSLQAVVSSTVWLSVCRVRTAYVSGTIGTGTMFHCVNPTTTQTAPSSGNAPTVVNLSGGGAGSGVVRAGSTVVAPTVYSPYLTLDPMLATSVLGLPLKVEDMDGEILLQPGASYQLQSIAAAGSSPLLASGVVWEEIPIPS